MGMYIAKRTERNGFLIAYDGEVMSEEEARRRGLIEDKKPQPKPKPRRAAKKKE